MFLREIFLIENTNANNKNKITSYIEYLITFYQIV